MTRESEIEIMALMRNMIKLYNGIDKTLSDFENEKAIIEIFGCIAKAKKIFKKESMYKVIEKIAENALREEKGGGKLNGQRGI